MRKLKEAHGKGSRQQRGTPRFFRSQRTVAVGLIGFLFFFLGSRHFVCADQLYYTKGSSAADGGQMVEGELLLKALDGTALFRDRQGRLLIVPPADIDRIETSETPPEPFSFQEVGEQLLKELPEGFKIYESEHYLIAYQTEKNYAKWISQLYENRLKTQFKKFWGGRKFKIKTEEPKFPLVTVIFANRASYTAYVRRELDSDPPIAYYNVMTNRIAMFDLTSDSAVSTRSNNGQRNLNQVFQDPRIIPMVTTIIHEGTHQLMFNTGLQTRMADMPLWLNEGIAMYFETPDLNNKRGWRAPGKINYIRLRDLKSAASRPPDFLTQLVASDARHQTAVSDAYAESWALTHFLLTKKSRQFSQYLQFLANQPPGGKPQEGQRLEDFQRYFGNDMNQLTRELVNYIRRLR